MSQTSNLKKINFTQISLLTKILFIEFLQWAIAPWIALCSSSIDDASELYVPPAPPTLPTVTPENPLRERIPEWLGDDLIDEGQLETQLFLLGYLKFPEKEWENPPEFSFLVLLLLLLCLADTAIWSLTDPTQVAFVTPPPPPIFCCCFWDNFSYSGFTFFTYFLITSLAVALILFTDELLLLLAETVSWSCRFLFSFLNSLVREKYLAFLICWNPPLSFLNSSSSVTELGLEESHSASKTSSLLKEELESLLEALPVESREAVVPVSQQEEEEVLDEANRRVRTMEILGERCKGKSWPL